MFTKAERLISLRNLKPKKGGFLKSYFNIFISRNYARSCYFNYSNVSNERVQDGSYKKILGLNPHIVIQPNSFKIDNDFILKLKDFKQISLTKSYSGGYNN